MSTRKYLLLGLLALFTQLSLAACGDLSPTPGSGVIPSSPIATPATTTVGTTTNLGTKGATTTAAKTPLIASGLTKGTLKEVFPILAQLSTNAQSIRIKQAESNMGWDDENTYTLNRAKQDFKGVGLFETLCWMPNGLILERADEINFPANDVRQFFEQIIQTPIVEKSYQTPPLIMTDFDQKLSFEIETPVGTLKVWSESQKKDFSPWAIAFQGRTFASAEGTPFQAYTFIKPYFKTQLTTNGGESTKPFIQADELSPPPPPLHPLQKVQQKQFNLSDLDKRIRVELSYNSTKKLWAVMNQKGVDERELQIVTDQNQLLLEKDVSKELGVKWVNNLIFSPDGKYVAGFFGEERGRTYEAGAWVWEVATGRLVLTLNGHTRGVWALTFSADGKTLVSASSDRTVRVWSLPDGKNTAVLQAKLPDIYTFLSVAISPDGKRVAAAGRGDVVKGYFPIKVWDLDKANQETTLKGHSGYVTNLAFNPDGRNLLSADQKGNLFQWDSTTWQQRNSQTGLPTLTSLAFSPDGQQIATTHRSGELRVWDAATLKPLSVTIVAKPPKDYIWTETQAFFSADGKSIMIGDLLNFTFSQWAAQP